MPPPHIDKTPRFQTAVSLIVFGLFACQTNGAVHYVDGYSVSEDNVLTLSGGSSYNGIAYSLLYASNNESLEYNGLRFNTNPVISWNQYSFQISNNSSLTINGDTQGIVDASLPANGQIGNDAGTYAIYAGRNSSIHLNGNVDMRVEHDIGNDKQADVGANLLYARHESSIDIGTENSSVQLWVLAAQPDLISAKNGSTVTFHSTQNQLIGSIDMMDDLSAGAESGDNKGNTVAVVLSGSDSYWFGDEKTWMNSDAPKDIDTGDKFSVVLENGAQWTYFGLDYSRDANGKTYHAVPKRISEITLNGGIVNLFDENIKDRWTEIGLWDTLLNGEYGIDPTTVHDYVRIGNLQGESGIFRMNLNAEDKTQSDMLYIESGSGNFYFEPYDLTLLESIDPKHNTLTFALTGKNAAGVKFQDKVNLEGETLYQYELEIASKPIEEGDFSENDYWDKTSQLNEDDPAKFEVSEEYAEGTNWYIRRVTMMESTAARAMTGTGYAAYDAAVEMDRRDRRLAESVRSPESNNGLWVRISHGQSGIDDQYRWNRTGIHVGFDREIVPGNTLGAWFSYTKGDADLLDINGRGTSDMTRYELAVYNTITLGSQYLDLVGRFGRVNTEFDAMSSAYHTTGDFHEDYVAVSAEYGVTLRHHSSGFFFEPQVQMQAAFLRSYDYDSDRGMRVVTDSDTSLQGRAGLRAGRQFADDFSSGELYARADILHQFTDGQDAVFHDDDGHVMNAEWGDRGTWGILGLGGAVSWGKAYGLQFNVERALGGDIDNTWLITGRFNYAF